MDDDYLNYDDLINDYIADNDDGSPPPGFEEFEDGPPDPYEFEELEKVNNVDGGLNVKNSGSTARADHNHTNGGSWDVNNADNADDANNVDNVDMEGNDPANDDDAVPKLISTSNSNESNEATEAPTSTLLSTIPTRTRPTSWRTNNDEIDLYGFERYNGLSSWRSSNKYGNNDGNSNHGVTTMEATSWKKRPADEKGGKKARDKYNKCDNHNDYDDYGEEGSLDEDNLDHGRKRTRGGGANGAGNGSIGGFGVNGGLGSLGSRGKGADAQLVRFRERQEEEVHGRSWGRHGGYGSYGGNSRRILEEERFVYGRKSNQCNVESKTESTVNEANRLNTNACGTEELNRDHSMPRLGEDSIAVTTADGSRIYVRRSNYGISKSELSSEKAENASKEEGKEGREGCLLGSPMSEIIRRADIIEKRAIKRKLEREGRNQNKQNNENNAQGTPQVDMNMTEVEESNTKENETNDGEIMEEEERTIQNRKKDEMKTLNEAKHHRREMQHKQRLWVDKHAPTSISHLLSDERTNREVLRALREWDRYVFKRDPPPRPTPAYPGYASYNSYTANSNFNANGFRNNKMRNNFKSGRQGKEGDDDDEKVDNQRVDVRPDETSRVILLSGPPGVGKSTLAHIVCKHAGYRPIEVNASDERSASSLTERVTRAMESSTLNLGDNDEDNSMAGKFGKAGKAGKPNCIILDEVDGADAKSSIAALVDIIRADIPPPTKGGSKGKKGGSGGRAARQQTYLRRPIILICNHKHAPALRPILPYAKQFDVQPPNPERLASRLRAVLASESMTVVAGGMLLHRLVAATGGDVRSCLYALQFASARARELAARKRERECGAPREGKGAQLMVDISSTLMAALGEKGNGMKDMQTDVSTTVATVFRKEKSRYSGKLQKTSSIAAFNSDATPKCADLVLKAVDHFGDNSKTLDCLFMNVNRVSYVDPTLDRCSVAFEWLSGADTYRSNKSNVAMNNSAEHQSMQKFYMPSAAAAIHLLCSVETRQDLTFSTRPLSDLYYQNEANIALVHRFIEGLSPRSRCGVGGGTDVVVSDVIPFSLWLLSAGEGKHSLCKPVSSVDYLSAEEKLAFSAHVATLRALGLTYVKEDEGFTYSHVANENIRLEPEINKLVRFEDIGESYSLDRKVVPGVLKELLAHGATVAVLRERESESKMAQERVEKAVVTKEKEKDPSQSNPSQKPDNNSTKNSATPNSNPKTQPKKSGSNSSVAKNFLGVRAAKAKENKTARRAARVGFDRSTKVKLSNTGSGVEISKVIRFKYQKGFTQAVRAPCQMEDLL